MATADVRTFWSAFVRVLLACIAALGFATPARTRTAATTAATPSPTGTPAPADAANTQARTEARAGTRAEARAHARAEARTGVVRAGARAEARAGAQAEAGARPGSRTVPAPRAAFGYPPRRDRRNRTLPPTMKQRIQAEAHGSTPAARSVVALDLPGEELAALSAMPTASGATAAPVRSARRAGVLTAPRAHVPAPARAGARTAHIPAPRPRAHEALCD